MTYFFYFIQKKRHFFVFLILEIIAASLVIKAYYFHDMVLLNSANAVCGKIFALENQFSRYLALDKENDRLSAENAKLKTKLSSIEHTNYCPKEKISVVDSSQNQRYQFLPARITWNSINKNNNYFNLNKGKKDHVYTDMAVVTDKGVMGIIDYTTRNFSRAISLLNENILIDANIKNKGIFGTVSWDGQSPDYVRLTGVPKHKNIRINDTVVTAIQSTIFPSGIPIGTITSFRLEQGSDDYIAKVKLFENLAKIKHVYIVTDIDKKEIDSLDFSY